ncbi:MAG: hypothetical protein IT435_03055 [Phycisphaerales bacterium]|nr:hypothetical protein [Phycisphaerales bacterium]
MKPLPTWAKAGAIATGVLIAGYLAYAKLYAEPVRERSEAIDREREASIKLDEQLSETVGIRRGLKAIGATTLGKKEDLVIARFRDGLSAIAGRNGLNGIVVSSGPPTPVPNPAIRERIPSPVKSKLRALRGDFSVIQGRLKASGPLESALRTLAVVEAQPWAHRVDGFSLTPVGKDREWVELQIDVATMFVPDLALADAEPLPADPVSGHDVIWRAIAGKNIFKNPPPPPTPVQPPVEIAAQPAAAPPAVPPPVPPPPYQEWKVVGIIVSGESCEVTVVNARTGERATLTPGNKALNATLVRGDGEIAVFEIDGHAYEFAPGQTLAVRTPARG